MMRTSWKRMSAVVVAVAAGAAFALPLSAVARAESSGVPRAVPTTAYHWEWSNGSTAVTRKFSQRVYGPARNLPQLVVSGMCSDGARTGDVIKLQWRNSYGKYITEDRHVVSDCDSYGTFELDPYTSTGAWSIGIYKYRIIVSGAGGMVRYFTITYARR